MRYNPDEYDSFWVPSGALVIDFQEGMVPRTDGQDLRSSGSDAFYGLGAVFLPYNPEVYPAAQKSSSSVHVHRTSASMVKVI